MQDVAVDGPKILGDSGRRTVEPPAGRRRHYWLAVGAFVLLALLVKAPQLVLPMGQDQGLYHAVAAEILRGGVPYRDAWDPKPPGVFYTHAALLALISDPWRPCRLGALPGLSHSDLQPRCGTLLFGTVDFVYALALGGLTFLVARRLGFSGTAGMLAFGFTAIFTNLALLDPEGSTPEKYALGPAVGVVLAALVALQSGARRWLVLAGVLGGVAALFKIPDLASFGAVSLMLLSLRRWRDLVWLWIPLVVVLVGVVGLFVVMGAGGPIVEATLTYNFARFGFQSERIPYTALVAAWQLFRDGLAPLWLPAALGAAVVWPRHKILVVWATLDGLALFLGGTKFTREYFLQLVPSFSLLAAAGLQSVWATRAREWLVLSVAAICLLSEPFQAGFTVRAWNEYIVNGWTTTSVERLASMVAGLPARETLFVWGDEAELYALPGRAPPTRFLNWAGVAANADPAVRTRRAEMMATLTSAPPAVIVVDRRTTTDDPDGRLQLNVAYFPELRQLLEEQYQQMDDAVLRPYLGGDREQVFVRRGAPDLCPQMPGCHLS
jgi:hypothetical protein